MDLDLARPACQVDTKDQWRLGWTWRFIRCWVVSKRSPYVAAAILMLFVAYNFAIFCINLVSRSAKCPHARMLSTSDDDQGSASGDGGEENVGRVTWERRGNFGRVVESQPNNHPKTNLIRIIRKRSHPNNQTGESGRSGSSTMPDHSLRGNNSNKVHLKDIQCRDSSWHIFYRGSIQGSIQEQEFRSLGLLNEFGVDSVPVGRTVQQPLRTTIMECSFVAAKFQTEMCRRSIKNRYWVIGDGKGQNPGMEIGSSRNFASRQRVMQDEKKQWIPLWRLGTGSEEGIRPLIRESDQTTFYVPNRALCYYNSESELFECTRQNLAPCKGADRPQKLPASTRFKVYIPVAEVCAQFPSEYTESEQIAVLRKQLEISKKTMSPPHLGRVQRTRSFLLLCHIGGCSQSLDEYVQDGDVQFVRVKDWSDPKKPVEIHTFPLV